MSKPVWHYSDAEIARIVSRMPTEFSCDVTAFEMMAEDVRDARDRIARLEAVCRQAFNECHGKLSQDCINKLESLSGG